jgi:transglutaminase-like putative cysteine protease
MRLDIRYVTRFAYAQPVRESHNELRVCPVTDDSQQLVSYRLTTTPPARALPTTDYWGNRVDAFGIRPPHTELEIVAESVVETRPSQPLEGTVPIAALADPVFHDAHVEYLQPSAHADWGSRVEEETRRRLDSSGGDAVALLRDLDHGVGTLLSYAPGTTYVGMPVDDVLSAGEGVCQDYAHLGIALCRAAGIPARYVSGYLFAVDDSTGEAGTEERVVVQTHAWVEAALPGMGWHALDPTNRQPVGERHVKIGHGRDYEDVPPLRGAFSGPPQHTMDVHVEISRSAAAQQQQ